MDGGGGMNRKSAVKRFKSGDIIRYGSGVSALFRYDGTHNCGSLYGTHVLGGVCGASDQTFFDLQPASAEDIEFCKSHRPEWFDVGAESSVDIVQRLQVYNSDWRTRANSSKEVAEAIAEIERLRALLNTPETADFMKAIPLEAAHQRERWGADHDAGKAPLDWFWLIGYLAQKAATSAIAGDVEKAKHHTISTAAALSNWHLQLAGGDNRMRPGIAEPSSDAHRPGGA